MASSSVTVISTASVLLLFLSYVKNVESIPHYPAIPRTLTGRTAETSQAPVYYENYLQCRYQICENTEDYPEDAILRVMRDTKNMQGFFGVILNSTTDSIIETRFGLENPKKLCSPQFNGTFRPRVLRNINLTWKFVVNVDGYFQRFTSEMCMSHLGDKTQDPNQPCTSFGYQCRQNYAEVYLLTYENGIIDFDKFMVPTTCNCVCDM